LDLIDKLVMYGVQRKDYLKLQSIPMSLRDKVWSLFNIALERCSTNFEYQSWIYLMMAKFRIKEGKSGDRLLELATNAQLND
jgi:hypothetical protein